MKHLVLFSAVFLSLILTASAVYPADTSPERIRIASAYGGVITNSHKDSKYKLNMKDTGAMAGLYCQWVETGLFQTNFFLYGTPDVNYSRVAGLHGNADAYFLNGGWGSLVAGIDVEDINIRMRAGTHIAGLDEFSMNNNVLFLMGRAGAKFKASPTDSVNISLFPYAGITRETVDVRVTVNPSPVTIPGPPFTIDPAKTVTDKTDAENYFSWGTNLNVNILHFIDFTAKYLGRAKKGEYLHSVTAQANIYFTRSFGLSFQSKYMETDRQSYDLYNILGVTLMF